MSSAPISEQQKQQIIDGYKRLVSEQQQLASLLIERESDAEEHRLVASSLKKTDETKKAWRLVGGVLVEGTVAEVLVEVEKQCEGLNGVVENARQQLSRKGDELKAYEKRYGITVKDRGMSAADTTSASPASKQTGTTNTAGVLVK